MGLRRSLEKNLPELRAWFGGRLPRFVTGPRVRSLADDPAIAGGVPVFIFHGVGPERLERQLSHLVKNRYRTLDADELHAALTTRPVSVPSVALTFDDATWSFWAFAYPLLRRLDLRAIVFAIPGLVSDSPASYPNLHDVWEGRADRESVRRRALEQPLCTWAELEAMHASGHVDIQSHSQTHQRVPVSGRIVDTLHPGFDTDYYGNVAVPVSAADDPRAPERALRHGAPVLESAPRLAGRPRFVASSEIADGASVLPGRLESAEELAAAIRYEFVESKRVLESRLAGKTVRHFCYPWFSGSALADRIAYEAGYVSLHYGLEETGPSGGALRVSRISEEYLERLPGRGRRSVASIWLERLRRRGHPRGLGVSRPR